MHRHRFTQLQRHLSGHSIISVSWCSIKISFCTFSQFTQCSCSYILQGRILRKLKLATWKWSGTNSRLGRWGWERSNYGYLDKNRIVTIVEYWLWLVTCGSHLWTDNTSTSGNVKLGRGGGGKPGVGTSVWIFYISGTGLFIGKWGAVAVIYTVGLHVQCKRIVHAHVSKSYQFYWSLYTVCLVACYNN